MDFNMYQLQHHQGALGELQSRGAGRGPRTFRGGGFSHGAAADVALTAPERAHAHRGDARTHPHGGLVMAGASHGTYGNGSQDKVMVDLGCFLGYC